MAHSIPPFMFLTTNSAVIISPIMVRRPLPCVIDPKVTMHTVNTKNALGPIPGAIPKGIRATKATNNVLIKATREVVVNTAP